MSEPATDARGGRRMGRTARRGSALVGTMLVLVALLGLLSATVIVSSLEV